MPPLPFNNDPAAGFVLDQKQVAVETAKFLKGATDLTADYNSSYTNAINAQRTSTVIVELETVVTLAPTPAVRDGLLPRTGATANSVEITLTEDEYYKVGIDRLGVAPSVTNAKIGVAGAKALVRAGNANLLRTLEAEGQASYLGRNLATSTTTPEHVWQALLGLNTTFQESDVLDELVLTIKPSVWNKLLSGIVTLTSAQNPQERAATLLGIDTVRVANLPTALATLAAKGGVATAKVQTALEQSREDGDDIVFGRAKLGSKVLQDGDTPNPVLVLKDGTGS